MNDSDWTYLTLPVLRAADFVDNTRNLTVPRKRKVYVTGKDEPEDRYAVVELDEVDPIWGTDARFGTVYYVFKRTNEAAPGDVVVVLHERKLTVRHYEPQDNGKVCLRSVEPKCPTWILPADEVNIKGVVVKWGVDLHDSGWA
jgi:hypothetical protein